MRKQLHSMVWVVVMALTMALLIQGVYAQEQEKSGEKKEEVKKAPAPEEGRRSGEPGRREGDRDRGQRRGFDPAMMQERMLSRMKETIGSSEEEWKAIEPLAKKVMDAQMKSRMGGFMGRREGGPETPSEVEALRNALESEQSKPEDIKQKLEAYRNMRKKNEEELKKAQQELKKVLTVKQEAQLVLMGTLE